MFIVLAPLTPYNQVDAAVDLFSRSGAPGAGRLEDVRRDRHERHVCPCAPLQPGWTVSRVGVGRVCQTSRPHRDNQQSVQVQP